MLTTAEVAALLDVTPRRVRAIKHLIRHEMRGGCLFFYHWAVEKYIKSKARREAKR